MQSLTRLATYHDIRTFDIVRSFVSKTGYFFGANEREMHQLELIAEEASAFIINTLRPDKENLFEIEIEPIQNGLRFYFYSKGEPIDEENIPVYDSTNPQESAQGLPFFLLENLSDAMQFKNRGKDGWVLIFEKRFRLFQALEKEEIIDESILKACSKEELSISIATPKDSYSIIKLTYMTYRYSYAKEAFYYRKQLEEAIADKKIIIFIAKNHKGEVVISSSYYRSSKSNAIAESAMLMSQPQYRQNLALLRLTRTQFKFLSENKEGICITYTNLVTTHTRSQRLTSHYDYFPTALKLSVHKQVDFIGIDVEDEQRESLLYALSIKCELEPTLLYIPKVHYSMTIKLLQKFSHLTLATDEAVPQKGSSEFSVEKHTDASYAIIDIQKVAQKWIEQLRHTIKELRDDGFITIFVYITATMPLPINFEDSMRQAGLFYSGITIETKKEWKLLYTALQGQHFDFSSLQLHEDIAIELKEYIYKQFKTLELL